MNYRPSRADHDVWMRPAFKVYGFNYHEYVLCYVENILLISHVPLKTSNGIKAVFNIKWDKSEPPEMYLGFVLQKVTKNDGTECWKTSSAKYLGDAINNVEEKLAKHELKMSTRYDTPLSSNYHTSEDTTPELDTRGVQHFLGATRIIEKRGGVSKSGNFVRS